MTSAVLQILLISNIFFLVQCDGVSLQNQVLMIYNIARKYPKQTAIELQQLTCLQLLLNCSSPPVRVISKSIVSFLADYMDISLVGTLSLTNEEVLFFTDGFASFINSGRISTDRLVLPVEELLYSFQRICSLPCDKSCCALPCLLDTLLALSLHDDKTIAKTALEVLWNISMEPTVALAILCHENMVCTLQKMSVFNTALADLARSILWILGYGNVGGEWHALLILFYYFKSTCFLFGMCHFLLQISLVVVSMQVCATTLASMQKPFYGVTMY